MGTFIGAGIADEVIAGSKEMNALKVDFNHLKGALEDAVTRALANTSIRSCGWSRPLSDGIYVGLELNEFGHAKLYLRVDDVQIRRDSEMTLKMWRLAFENRSVFVDLAATASGHGLRYPQFMEALARYRG